MKAVSSSWAVLALLMPLFGLSLPGTAHAGDGKVQTIPTQPPLLTGDSDHDKLVLTAGTEAGHDDLERPHVTMVEEGTSSRRAKNEAIDALALQRLPRPNQLLVQNVVDEVSIFRRLPAFRCEVDPEVHEYFVHHPEVAVGIWRAMGISQLKMWPTSDWAYGMDTSDGTTGTINVLYRSRESCLILCNGMFKSPFVQAPIAAQSVMHLRTTFSKDTTGRTFATHQADMFVAFPSQKIETVAKLISPLSNVIIDRNFQEISLFIHVMWLAMGRQPGWVEQIAGDLDGVSEERRKKLLDLTARVYVDTQKAMRGRAGEPATLEAIRPPTRDTATQPVSAERSVDAPAAAARR